MTILPISAESRISIPAGTSVVGCEIVNECYIPAIVTATVGEKVTWSNNDSAAHTVTSGTPKDGSYGVFDSGMLMAGANFAHTFEKEGIFDYYCIVHPWMIGVVTIQPINNVSTQSQGNGTAESPTGEMHESQEDTVVYGTIPDGSIKVEIGTATPVSGKNMKININFLDPIKSTPDNEVIVDHLNYDISATQEGREILSDKENYAPSGGGEHITQILTSDAPIDIKVTILGIGENKPFWGPTGEVLFFHIVPEFGTIAVMILAVAITSIIIVSTKSKININPRI
jgi:predicted secreted protein with PEFG-CTERM motif